VSDPFALRFDDPYPKPYSDMAGPLHWPSIEPDDLPAAFAELQDWVEALIIRFALDARVVPPCWRQHNGIIEALSALRDHERISYAETASPTAAVDWFRALRDIEARLIELAGKTQCSAHEHRPDPTPAVSKCPSRPAM